MERRLVAEGSSLPEVSHTSTGVMFPSASYLEASPYCDEVCNDCSKVASDRSMFV